MRTTKWAMGVAGVGIAAVTWWTSHATARVEEPISAPRAGATAPAPAPAAVPVTPPTDTTSCERKLQAMKDGLGASALDDDAANALTTTARSTAASDATTDTACALRAYQLLAADRSCGRGKTAIVAGLFVGDLFQADWTAQLVDDGSPACLRALLPAVQSTTNVSVRLEGSVEKIARSSPDPELRDAGWLALGSIELAAKNRGATDVVRLADAALRSKLDAANGNERTTLLEAAGNGACDGCRDQIVRARTDDDPRVRAAAVGASRFAPEPDAVDTMCDRLRRDDEAGVREQAAWAMGWRPEHDSPRVDCLASAAAKDGAPGVRRAATRSLTVLGPRSTRAVSALDRLAKESDDPDVRRIADEYRRSGGAPFDPAEVGL